MAGKPDTDGREGRRIAARAGGEGDILAGHRPPAAADEDDPIERLGTRIGRALGIAITVALMIWFVVTIFRMEP